MTDYEIALTASAYFDRSATAKLRVAGPDAGMFLGNLGTNDIKSLPVGGACETFFCDHRAKALFSARVYRHADCIWLHAAAGRGPALLKHLDRYLISEQVELEDVTARYAEFHVAGPTAAEVASGLSADLFLYPSAPSPLNLPGFDIVCPADHSEAVQAGLLAAGAVLGSRETWETLRIEAGTPAEGVDFDDTRFVLEVGNAARAVSYEKGCYLGQEPIVMSRDRAGHTPRAFVGIKITGEAPAPGAKISLSGEEIGHVTSAAFSPRWGAIALGYVRWKHREAGTAVTVGQADGQVLGIPPLPLPPGPT